MKTELKIIVVCALCMLPGMLIEQYMTDAMWSGLAFFYGGTIYKEFLMHEARRDKNE